MDSEVCYDVAKGSDGQIWAATSAGVGRFDGKEWRFGQQSEGKSTDGEAPATRALAGDGSGRMWLATARGLRVLDAREAGARTVAAGARVVDDDVLDLALDRFGRVWALGAAALAVVETQSGEIGGTR
jgi:ligand-binding sensor domain-containing protein